jgi:hypothetical protein
LFKPLYIRPSGTLQGSHVFEVYPKTNGTSSENTRFSVDIRDNTGPTGFVAANFYGTGGADNS